MKAQANPLKNDTTYNGWTNYETWLVALHLDNERGTQSDVYALANGGMAVGEAADAIRDYTEEMLYGHENLSPMVVDLLRSALAEVNWVEIAKARREVQA